MELAQVFECPCNNKTYPSVKSLKSHKKTKMHISWEDKSELRELKKDLTIRDNNIMKLEKRIHTLIDLNNILLQKLNV